MHAGPHHPGGVGGLDGTKVPAIKAWDFSDGFSDVNAGKGHVDRI